MRTNLWTAGLALALLNSWPAALGADILPPSITVTGTGKAHARPDIATINVGVVTQASSAVAAMSANTAAMTELTKTLSEQGIGERDVQTISFNVNPEYRQDGNGPIQRGPGKIVGYRVVNDVRVKVRKVAQLGALLDAVVVSGANQVNGIQFSIEDTESVLSQARQEAMANARKQAEIYAKGAGVPLGKVIYVTESGGISPMPPPVPRMAFAAMQSINAPVPIASGEEDLVVRVNVIFSIGQ